MGREDGGGVCLTETNPVFSYHTQNTYTHSTHTHTAHTHTDTQTPSTAHTCLDEFL